MSYTRLLYHLIFRTKYSIPAIDINYEKELYSYIWGFLNNKGCILYRIGGMPDHLHIYTEMQSKIALADYVRDIKVSSSKWLQNNPHFPAFRGWGRRYGAFTSSISEKDTIINYIANQKQHHIGLSTEEEFRSILAAHGCEINEVFFMNDDD